MKIRGGFTVHTSNFSNYGSSSFGRTQYQPTQQSQLSQQSQQNQQNQQNQQSQQSQQSFQSSMGTSSQYQGIQKQYQPVGYVQSFYGQNAQRSNQGYGQATSSYTQATSPASMHTANYRGNQSSAGQAAQQSTSSFQNAGQQFGSQYGSMAQSNQSFGQTPVSPNAYHTANYRGNQNASEAFSQSPIQASYPSGMGSQGISAFNQYGQSGQQFGSNS